MKCGNCIYYYELDICLKKGTRVSHDNNICEDYICTYNEFGDIKQNDNNHSIKG